MVSYAHLERILDAVRAGFNAELAKRDAKITALEQKVRTVKNVRAKKVQGEWIASVTTTTETHGPELDIVEPAWRRLDTK